MDAQALAEAKARMIARWDRAAPVEAVDESMARFESIAPQRRPRGGLAVGHSVNKDTGEPQLEVRVTAGAGPNYQEAHKLAAEARAEGLNAIVVAVKNAFAPVAPAAAPMIAGRRRPLHIGASVAHINAMAGTLGAFVKVDGGGTGIVSCGHVLARFGKKWAEVNDQVHQPGMPDQKPVVARNRIGVLTDIFAPFIDVQTDNLDVVGQPLAAGELPIGERIVKVGRSTGATEATISALDFQNLQVEFISGRSSERFTFSGVYEVIWDDAPHPYATGGDSGSLVMTRDGLHPIGLHFASLEGRSGTKYSYVVPWPRIMTTFELELI